MCSLRGSVNSCPPISVSTLPGSRPGRPASHVRARSRASVAPLPRADMSMSLEGRPRRPVERSWSAMYCLSSDSTPLRQSISRLARAWLERPERAQLVGERLRALGGALGPALGELLLVGEQLLAGLGLPA